MIMRFPGNVKCVVMKCSLAALRRGLDARYSRCDKEGLKSG